MIASFGPVPAGDDRLPPGRSASSFGSDLAPADPIADAKAILRGDNWRVTVLTGALLRLEWSDDGEFEDRASTFAVNRRLAVPDFTVTDSADVLELVTDQLRMSYDRRPFSPQGLVVESRDPRIRHTAQWRFGSAENHVVLGGTARTLDGVDGRLPLDPGVVARRGVPVVDDSQSLLFGADGSLTVRVPGRRDLYVFGHGLDHRGALDAFSAVSGRPPLLPRWVFGNWWSRYHRYSATEYVKLLDRFTAERLPFSVAVLDMDWHRVDSVPAAAGSGWTGYSWERSLFPDPAGFLAELHRRGLRVTLNLHPADGVRSFEDAYPALARVLGRDPDDGTLIPFDATDPVFLRAYLDELHHPLETEGVDFWWIDWQQGRFSRVAGVDPLWVLNELHFRDSGRDGRRPLTFSRYAGPGSHRYPIGFSGDTVVSWASLDFQPEFTASASNIGYGWWSHDVGGHIGGIRDDELATRWVQLGVFSPILRLHSSNNPFLLKEPWHYPRESRDAMGAALRLRARLVPYLYTANHVAAATGRPLVAPVYHEHPDRNEAYTVPNEFTFGTELLVAPITTPRDPVTLRGAVSAWLPPGSWTDITTGTVYTGDRHLRLHRDSTSVPALLRGGGILPLAGPAGSTDPTGRVSAKASSDTSGGEVSGLDAALNPDVFEVLVATGADGCFMLVEDDGSGATLTEVVTARTPLSWDDTAGRLTVGPVIGAVHAVPATRTWTVTFPGLAAGTTLRALVDGVPAGAPAEGAAASVWMADAPTSSELTVEITGVRTRRNNPDEAAVELLAAAQTRNDDKLAALTALRSGQPVAVRIASLTALGLPASLLSALTELLTADPDAADRDRPNAATTGSGAP